MQFEYADFESGILISVKDQHQHAKADQKLKLKFCSMYVIRLCKFRIWYSFQCFWSASACKSLLIIAKFKFY